MKLRLDPHLGHQRRAVEAVVEAFSGCAYAAPQPEPLSAGGFVVPNRAPTPGAMPPELTVEMETGTGKTYVFIRAALELAQRFGWTKFVVVVPSVAIREGVLKTLQITREHFGELYPGLRYRFFVYGRERLHRLRAFLQAAQVEFMVLTIDAFNKTSNVLRQPCDHFGGAVPLEAVAACRPVLLLDEPHHLQSPLRVQALADLSPLTSLRFGATPRGHKAPIHRLTPRQAHQQGLVKTVQVVGARVQEPLEARFSAQIRDTIACHLRRQAELAARGVKVLSLFFVDRVASYVGPQAVVRQLFDQHFDGLKHEFPAFRQRTAASVRSAYFAVSGKRGAVDSRTGGSVADADSYNLIMRDKERLLGFAEPVAFIFTHSALREGWDNPNVLQICTLAHSHCATKKRQELGRGMRLCVDQQGARIADPAVNVLTVFANESYEAYARALQTELCDDFDQGDRPPLPAARTQARGDVEFDPNDATPWPALGTRGADLVSRAAELIGARVHAEPVCGRWRARSPELSLVDLIDAELRLRERRCALRRATILAVLRTLPESVAATVAAEDQAVLCANAILDALGQP